MESTQTIPEQQTERAQPLAPPLPLTVIHANVFDPSGPRLFKSKANDHAECQTLSCRNPSCPLLAAKTCYMRGGLFGNKCPYGQARVESGPTKRSTKRYEWVNRQKKLHDGVPFLGIPPAKMAFVGEFVLLPYPHMDMCEAVPFLQHSGLLSGGSPFIPRENWTLDVVLTLLQFRPQALFGGEITSYQKEAVPKFLVHLREVDPVMWSELVAVRPELGSQVSHIGRSAILRTLKSPIEWTESADKYPVKWHWDGKVLTTTSMNSYSGTWGRVKIESVLIHATPQADATVVVQANDWVTAETVFVD